MAVSTALSPPPTTRMRTPVYASASSRLYMTLGSSSPGTPSLRGLRRFSRHDEETRMDAAPGLLTLKSKAEIEQEIARRVEDERRRLEARRAVRAQTHFHRPVERPF